MEYIKWMLVICLIIGFINSGCGKPTDDNYDFQGDDDYTYYDDDKSSDLNSKEIASNFSSIEPPYFEQPESSVQTVEGDDIILKCDIKNFRINYVVLWYCGDTLIVQGGHILGNDRRIMTLPQNAIKIRNVSVSDTNDYYCQVLPDNIRQHTHLNVLQSGGHGRVAIFTHDRDVTERPMTAHQGDKVELECRAFGLENPQLKWSLNGFRAKEHVSRIVDGKLTIDSVDAEHAGRYQCLGDDGSSKLPIASVILNVLYAPKVATHRHHVNTAMGAKAELSCDYRAEPIAVVYWKKNNVRLASYTDKYMIKNEIVKGKNRTTLIVKDVNVNDLGEYECEAQNSIAIGSMKIKLALTPENPQFESMEIDGRKATLHWLVRSLQPLSDAVLDYQLDGSIRWTTETIIKTSKHPENTGYWKLTHSIELTPGLWHARVKTQNTAGWSKFSVAHDFKIDNESSEDIDVDAPEEVDPPPGEIVKAGISLGGGDKPSSSCKLNLVPSIVILCLSIISTFKLYLMR